MEHIGTNTQICD